MVLAIIYNHKTQGLFGQSPCLKREEIPVVLCLTLRPVQHSDAKFGRMYSDADLMVG